MNTREEIIKNFTEEKRKREVQSQKNVGLHKLQNLNENQKMALGYLSKAIEATDLKTVRELLGIIIMAG